MHTRVLAEPRLASQEEHLDLVTGSREVDVMPCQVPEQAGHVARHEIAVPGVKEAEGVQPVGVVKVEQRISDDLMLVTDGRMEHGSCPGLALIVIFPAAGSGGTLGAAMSAIGKVAMEPGFTASMIDTSKPHPARMYDAYLGGKDNYPVDREAVRQILRDYPEVRPIALANRAFLQRAVRFLAAEAGIRQFIDIGTGIPSAGNVHEVAGQAAAGTRVVYVDNDPIVHVHANALLTGSGTTSIVLADLRDPEAILAHPKVRGLIDFTEPVALLLVAILHFVGDEEDPAGIVARLRDALPDGSYLVLSHATPDFHPPGTASRAAATYVNATAPLVLRAFEQVSAFFDGFDLVEPGLVQAPLWRPEGKPPRPKDLLKIGIYAGVGRRSRERMLGD